MVFCSLLLSGLSYSFSAHAHPTMGVSVANAAVETLIISAPLPSLDGGSFTITPQYGVIKTQLVDKPGLFETEIPKPSHSGEVNGTSAGLGLTFASKSDLSFFIYGTGAQQTGDFQIAYDTAPTVHYTDFKVKAVTAFAAAQYRLVGDEKSGFAMGLFAGPGIYNFDSSLVYDQEGPGPAASTVEFNPSGTGMLTGLQMMFRAGGLRLNPYLMGFTNLGEACQEVEISTGQLNPSQFTCGGKEGYAEVPKGFGGVGIKLGYKSLLFNAFTMLPAQEVTPIKVTSYSLSIGISL